MKLPKCPHCEKLLVGMYAGGIIMGVEGKGEYREDITYFCPETQKRQQPDWVEVLEV
jgi:hypothetical protein